MCFWLSVSHCRCCELSEPVDPQLSPIAAGYLSSYGWVIPGVIVGLLVTSRLIQRFLDDSSPHPHPLQRISSCGEISHTCKRQTYSIRISQFLVTLQAWKQKQQPLVPLVISYPCKLAYSILTWFFSASQLILVQVFFCLFVCLTKKVKKPGVHSEQWLYVWPLIICMGLCISLFFKVWPKWQQLHYFST